MAVKFTIALENAVAAFFTYTLSLVAALSWNTAIQDALGKHDNWKRFTYAACITVFALLLITVVMLYHNTDEDDGRVDVGLRG